jgi:PAS domain-containing protein
MDKDVSKLITKMKFSTEIFVIISYNFEYIYANRVAEKVYGKTNEELEGKIIKDVFPQQWNFGPFKTTQRSVQAKQPLTIRYHSPFAKQWVELHGMPYENFYTFTYFPIDHKTVLKEELRNQIRKSK